MSRGVPGSARPTIVAFCLLAASLIAGCTGDEGVKLKSTNPGQIDLDDPNAILVAGVVVNDEVSPIADATVILSPTEQTAVTDEGGAFAFAVLEPGAYVLTVYKDFHIEVTHEVSVPLEGLADVTIMLTPTPDGVPYHTTETYASYSFCHGPIGGGCFIVNTVLATNYLPEDRPDFGYEIPENGFEELRFEAEWAGNYAGDGGFIARNPEGLFLACNDTKGAAADPLSSNGGKKYEPTERYYAGPDGGESVATPSRFWVGARTTNTDVGACHEMPSEKGDKIWQTVRIGGTDPSPFALNTRADVYLTFFFWAKSQERDFTVLEV